MTFINVKHKMLLGFDTWWTAVVGARRWGGVHTSLLTPLTGRGAPPLLPVLLCFFSLFLLLFLRAWFRFSTTVLLWRHPERQKILPSLWEMIPFLSCRVVSDGIMSVLILIRWLQIKWAQIRIDVNWGGGEGTVKDRAVLWVTQNKKNKKDSKCIKKLTLSIKHMIMLVCQ